MRAPDTIRVSSRSLWEGTISPLIYGDFVEFLNDMIPGMWAEKVEDRSFEGVTQPAHVYPPGTSWVYPRWRSFCCALPGPAGPVTPGGVNLEGLPDSVLFELDATRPFAGRQSAKVTVRAGDGRPRLCGIEQPGIPVTGTTKLRFEMYARSEGPEISRVRVRIGRNYGTFYRVYDELVLSGLSREWQRMAGELVPEVTDEAAVLSIGIEEAGAIWIDKVSLMPEDNLRGWRADVVRAVTELKPGIIRFGGSSLIFYDWETGIAPRPRRSAFLNQPWGNTESHDVGLFEFLELCELVGAEPLVCTNSNSSTTDSILHEIEFCNGSAESGFGRLRAKLGHPEPFGVKYWQIGNEQAGAEYERRLVADAKAIRARYPDLQLLASYPSQTIIKELSDVVDFVCPHFYVPYSTGGEKDLHDLIERIRKSARNPELRLAITEWNITAGAWEWGRSWLLTHYCALNAARMLQMYQRLGDMIRIANRSNMTNSCNSGIIQTSRTALYVTPTYHVQKAFASFSGDIPLDVEAAAGEPLGLSATRRGTDGEIALFVVNTEGAAQKRTVELESLSMDPGQAGVWTLAADSLEAVNSLVERDRVAPVQSVATVRGRKLEHVFPPFSVTVLRFPPSRRRIGPA